MQIIKQEREDVTPDGRAPREVRKFLLRAGGSNPYGEPMYRMVRADCVLILLGGAWHDWAEGTAIEDQGGLTFSDEKTIVENIIEIQGSGQKLKQFIETPTEMLVSKNQPVRIVREMRWVKRYPHLDGWLLMHWDPPALYGSRSWWESKRVPGAEGLMIMGPFPEKGRYEISTEWTAVENNRLVVNHAALPEIPPLSKLEEAIEAREWRRNNDRLSANPDFRRLTAMIEVQRIEALERKKHREYVQSYLKDKMKTYFGSSLAAGRIREALAQKAGVRSHVGN